MPETAGDLRWSVGQRLEFIEYRLFWEGMIRRIDLTEEFNISVPQASGDLALYQQQAPGNISYDSSRKYYVPSPEFKPLFIEPSASEYLMQLRLIADGISKEEDTWLGWVPPIAVLPFVRRRASAPKLRRVLAAIRHERAIYIQYQSMNRPEPLWRWITPHGLGFDGLRWHVRAKCHRTHEFRDFVVARMIAIDRDRENRIDPKEDRGWQETITFRIGPNPALETGAQRAVSLDYGMKNTVLELKTRLCLAWYLEKHLGLDLEQYKVPPARQQLVLLNRNEVENALKTAGEPE